MIPLYQHCEMCSAITTRRDTRASVLRALPFIALRASSIITPDCASLTGRVFFCISASSHSISISPVHKHTNTYETDANGRSRVANCVAKSTVMRFFCKRFYERSRARVRSSISSRTTTIVPICRRVARRRRQR